MGITHDPQAKANERARVKAHLSHLTFLPYDPDEARVSYSFPVTVNMAKIRDSPDLAKLFMNYLRKIDLNLDPNLDCGDDTIGYAVMFQFYLDFYEVAVLSSATERDVFPARPQEGCKYNTSQFSSHKFKSHGWRRLRDIQATLKDTYWTTHPLTEGTWKCKEDHDMWAKTAEVLAVVCRREDPKEITEEEALVLSNTMDICCVRLGKLLKKVQN